MPTINIVIAESDAMLTSLYRKMIEAVTGYTVTGTAADEAGLLSVLRRMDEDETNLVLLDIAILGDEGADAFLAIRSEFPRTDFIVLSSEKSPMAVRKAICSGAFDYLIKPFEWRRLAKAIEAYGEYCARLVNRSGPWRQEDLDRLLGFRMRIGAGKGVAPKGYQEGILARLVTLLRRSARPISAAEAGKMLGISRTRSAREALLSRGSPLPKGNTIDR